MDTPTDESQLILYVLACIGLYIISTFFSLAEGSILSANRIKLASLAKDNPRVKLVLKMLAEPEKMLGVLLIGNNIANIASSSVVSYVVLTMFGSWNLSLVMGIFSYLLIMFSELLPKTLATYYPEKIAVYCVYPLYWAVKLFYPMVYFSQLLIDMIFHLFRIEKKMDTKIELEEFAHMIKDINLAQSQKDVLISIIHLEKQELDEIMLPKKNMSGIDFSDGIEAIEENMSSLGSEYFLVYEGEFDNMVGVLYSSELVKYFLNNKHTKDELKKYLREPLFLPKDTKLIEHMDKFFEFTSYEKIAFVIDEYGNIEGVISRNLIIQNLLGSLDINRKETIGFMNLDGSYFLFGDATIFDINKKFDLDLPIDEPKTLSGFLIEELGVFPDGEFCLKYKEYFIEVGKIDSNIILYVNLRKNLL